MKLLRQSKMRMLVGGVYGTIKFALAWTAQVFIVAPGFLFMLLGGGLK